VTAIAESTPGPVAINSATYLGYKLAGVPGAAVATVAVCLPSFLIIYAISLFFEQFTQLTVIANAFKGIQVCVIYLIFSVQEHITFPPFCGPRATRPRLPHR